jgi:hypothetical protein
MRALALVVLLAGCDGDPNGWGACEHYSMPSDARMRACFAQQRVLIEKLAAMIESDRVDAVGTDRIGDCWLFVGDWGCGGLDGALAKAGLSQSRYREYRNLLDLVGGYRVDRRSDVVEISIYRVGIVTSGAGVGFVRSRVPFRNLVPDTQAIRRTSGSHAALGGDWYIEYQGN